MGDHLYGIELTDRDPLAEAPQKIKISLKPHQLTALQKCITMETQRTLRYNVPDIKPYLLNHRLPSREVIMQGYFEIATNVGIIGDIVGYGKTLIALALVCEVPCTHIYNETSKMFCSHGSHSAYFHGTSKHMQSPVSDSDSDSNLFHTTLVIVPRGPVYVQWKNAIQKQTDLNCLFIDNMYFVKGNMPGPHVTHADFKKYIERYDMVLIKSTTFKTVWDFYNHHRDVPLFQGWDRIFIDEAHDELSKVPSMRYKFLWMITSTHEMILNHFFNCNRYISHSLKDCLDEEKMLYMLVKSQPIYVRQSFDLPKPNEYFYICKLPTAVAAIQSYISPAILQKIHANDIAGAIRDLGGSSEYEDDLVDLVCKEFESNIHDKRMEISFLRSLQNLNAETREQRIANLEQDMMRLDGRLTALKDNIRLLKDHTCSICLFPFENPILLKCTHFFCGACLIQYLHINKDAHVCPMCREPINAARLIAIVQQPPPSSSASTSASASPPSLIPYQSIANGKFTKEEVFMKLMDMHPQGRFLVFSKQDASFIKIIQLLRQHNIPYAEIKGSTGQMINLLEKFKLGVLRVILLNTHNAGSGIDISVATDVVLFHHMGQEKTQAIGRAQRVGRNIPLNVHHLMYPSECTNTNT